MNDSDLQKFCRRTVEEGVTQAKLIHPSSIVTAPWVRLKCRFGCPNYGKSYCCPPDTPKPEATRTIVDAYRRAILFRIEVPQTPETEGHYERCLQMLTDLEGELFKAGYYKAFVILAGACQLCTKCAKLDGTPCHFLDRARPSMGACGIDVFQTASNNGLEIETLREKSEVHNRYCLMLVD